MLALTAPQAASAQIISVDGEKLDADSIRKDFDDRPYFGLYKDNYFIFGPTIGPKMTKENTNVKFQISIAQKLTRSTLPWGTYLYLFYSQKCFWNVLQNSMPMTDLNFNPGIGITKPLFVKNKYIGKATLMLEHESNGRDGLESRSWNKVSLAANIIIDNNLMVHGKIWAPIIDGMNNKDILKYCGIYQFGWQFQSMNRKWSSSVTLVKRSGWNFNYNIIADIAYRFSTKSNQYLYAQYYCGYGEGLLAYKEHHSQLRIGIVIKPTLFSEY